MKAARGDRGERARTLRFGADRICLWCVCGNPRCRRAKSCRGDVQACAGLMVAWMAALDAERRARPDFAAIESQIETAEELRAYRAWRNAAEQRGLRGRSRRRVT